jgi:DNA-binding NtrC family response regulator
MSVPLKLLVVDDEAIALNNLRHVLKKEGYEVKGTQSGTQALKWIEQEEFNLILTDLKMEKVDGMRLLKRAKELYPDTEVIMITGFATVDTAIKAMKAGAYHYVSKPYKLDEVRKVVKEALEKNQLKKENSRLRATLEGIHGATKLITDNAKMKSLLEMAGQVAASDTNVVISGESGTGKELLAKYIHQHSLRHKGPQLSINCGVFSEDLLANELFGHEKGAYTGATETKKGLVEIADGGTLFLDEITEMPPAMQVKLLRVLQEKEVMRVGGTKPIKVNVRIITATNRDLQEEVNNGRFRQDLFFRINVVSIRIPPLSERRDDIPLLVFHFLKKYSSLMSKEITEVSQEVLDVLMQYDFPGNVRELENIVERGVALVNGDTIEMAHLPEDLHGVNIQTFRKTEGGKFPSLEEMERTYIMWVLNETANNKTEAAATLGIDRVSLWRKLKKFGLEE